MRHGVVRYRVELGRAPRAPRCSTGIRVLHVAQAARQIACVTGAIRVGMIRVVMLGEPDEGRADVGRRGVAGDAQPLVKIAVAHRMRQALLGRAAMRDAVGSWAVGL